MAEEDEKSIEWYQNELRLADAKIKEQHKDLEGLNKTVLELLEEIAGLEAVIDRHYSNTELESMLKQCKDGRARQAEDIQKAIKWIGELEKKLRDAGVKP